jgi:hypothetical protein
MRVSVSKKESSKVLVAGGSQGVSNTKKGS